MSLATTCPACGTCFRVVQDQLKVSEGWVRCGHCQDVFNALDGLFDLDAPTPAVVPSPSSGSPHWSDAAALADAAADAGPSSAWSEPIEALPAPAPFTQDGAPPPRATEGANEQEAAGAGPPLPLPDDPAGMPLAASDEPVTAATHHSTADQPFTNADVTGTLPLATDDAPPAPVIEPPADSGFLPSFLQREAAADEVGAAPADPPPTPVLALTAEPEPADQPPGFMRAAERRARWEQPAVRVALSGVAVLLGAALVAQSAWHWRDRLAYSWPAARPLLAMVCAGLGCTLQAPRRIDALVVDNTVLSRPPGSPGYRLTVTLHNRADHPVAPPHLELALSDVQGTVSVRRVLTPADFHVDAAAAIAPQADVNWSLTFTLADSNGKAGADTGSTRAAGYTVAAFYP